MSDPTPSSSASPSQPVFYSADDALRPPPTVGWSVQGLLTQPSLNLLVGAPGAKKTFLAMDLAVCVALGKPWLDRPVTQSPVLFIDEDTGLNRVWARLNAALRGHAAGPGVPLHFVSFTGLDLRQPQDAETLTQRARDFGARLIVIDTLTGIMRGGDENSLVSVAPLIYHLRRLAEACQAAVFVVHHHNRQGAFRGSSAFAAAADLMLGIQSIPSEPIIKLTPLKSRHETPLPFCALAHFETSPQGDLLFHLTATDQQPEADRVVLGMVPEGILRRIEFLGYSTTVDLMHSVEEGAPSSIRQSVHDLFASGYIKRSDGGSRGKLAKFILTEKGKQYLAGLNDEST